MTTTYRPWPPRHADRPAAEQLDLLALVDPPRSTTERDLYAASGLIFETVHCADGDHVICTGIVDVTDGGTVGQLTPQTKHHGPCRCECHA